MQITKENFNAALNTAEFVVKDWNGGLTRMATANFKIKGVKGQIEVSVAVTPEIFSVYGQTTGHEVQVIHYQTPSNGVFIHWDHYGSRRVDIGFEIDRLDDLEILAQRSEAEISQALSELDSAISVYSNAMGMGASNRACTTDAVTHS